MNINNFYKHYIKKKEESMKIMKILPRKVIYGGLALLGACSSPPAAKVQLVESKIVNVTKAKDIAKSKISKYFSFEKSVWTEKLALVREDLSNSGYYVDNKLEVIRKGKMPENYPPINNEILVSNPVDSIAYLKAVFVENLKALAAVNPKEAIKYSALSSDNGKKINIQLKSIFNPIFSKMDVNGNIGDIKVNGEASNTLGFGKADISVSNAERLDDSRVEQDVDDILHDAVFASGRAAKGTYVLDIPATKKSVTYLEPIGYDFKEILNFYNELNKRVVQSEIEKLKLEK